MKFVINFLLPYLKKYRTKYLVGGLFTFITSILVLPTPLLTRRIFDDVLPTNNFSNLLLLCSIIIAVIITQTLLNYFQTIYYFRVNSRLILDIKLNLIKKINNTRLDFLQNYSSGYLTTRIEDDVNRIQGLLGDNIIFTIRDILSMFLCLSAIFYLNWKLAVFISVIYPLFGLVIIKHSKKISMKSVPYYEEYGMYKQQLEETINSVPAIKSHNRYKYNIVKFLKQFNRLFIKSYDLTKESQLNGIITNFTNNTFPILIIFVGGYSIISGSFTLGSLLAVNTFAMMMFGMVFRILSFNSNLQSVIPSIQRIIEVLNFPHEYEENEANKSHVRHMKIDNWEFGNIHYKYETETNHPLCFENLNFSLKSGDKIGIFGKSGGGKTTFIKILHGLFIADGMTLSINNLAVNDESVKHSILRSRIAYVEQEPFLFNDSIYNNVKFGNADATHSDILKALNDSHCTEFIDKLPDSYNTKVGFRGNNVSIGQKQRIAVARALLKNASILIFDEATSNLDSESTNAVLSAIFNLPDNIAIIIISHNKDIIDRCNKMYEMSDNKLIPFKTN